ncbi:MAG: tautomerase family protein [Sedimenticola sp.]
MPFVRISMVRGVTADFKHQISQPIHQSLVSIFWIPEDDIFQVIEELDQGNIIYPEKYMGIPYYREDYICPDYGQAW